MRALRRRCSSGKAPTLFFVVVVVAIMEARRDVALSFLLPSGDDPLADLVRFRKIWQSIALENPGLVDQTRAVFLLSRGRASSEPTSAAAELWGHAPVFQVTGESWGRCFNDLLLCVTMCEEVRHWVHWDDEHVCSRPFWNSARAVLEGAGSYLSQLQLADDGWRLPTSRLLVRDGFTQLIAHPDVAAKRLEPDDHNGGPLWPVFALGPSVQPLAPYRAAMRAGLLFKPFDEEVDDWATLEWRFGLRLEELGAVAGVLNPATAKALDEDEDEDEDEDCCRCSSFSSS
jgi:hypothetical protein